MLTKPSIALPYLKLLRPVKYMYQNRVSDVVLLWWPLLHVLQTTIIPSSDYIVELISHPENALSSYHHLSSLNLVPELGYQDSHSVNPLYKAYYLLHLG